MKRRKIEEMYLGFDKESLTEPTTARFIFFNNIQPSKFQSISIKWTPKCKYQPQDLLKTLGAFPPSRRLLGAFPPSPKVVAAANLAKHLVGAPDMPDLSFLHFFFVLRKGLGKESFSIFFYDNQFFYKGSGIIAFYKGVVLSN